MRFWQKPNQGHCLQSVVIETTHSCQTGTFKPAGRVITLLWHARLSPCNHQTARPPISTGNIGKWLSEIIFGWKHYSWKTNDSVEHIAVFIFQSTSQFVQQIAVVWPSNDLSLWKVICENDSLTVPESWEHDLPCRLLHLCLFLKDGNRHAHGFGL